MTKKRKLILSSGLLVSASLATIVVSCGSETETPKTPTPPTRKALTLDELINPVKETQVGLGSLNKLAKERIYRSVSGDTYSQGAFPYDQSTSFGNSRSRSVDSTVVRLVTVRNQGEPSYDQSSVVNPDTGIATLSNIKVLRPSVWSYELTGADAVVITTTDGKEIVFDSDEAEVVPALTVENQYYASGYERLRSNNSKSINSLAFEEALAKAKKMSYRIRQNVSWVNNKGVDSGFKLTAEDYFIGYLRTRLFDSNYRRTNGGSREIDTAARDLASVPGNNWSDRNYQNAYLFNLYGIDGNKFLERSQFVTKDKDDRELVNVYAAEDDSPKQFKLMFETMTTSNEYSPAPSGYIKSLADKNEVLVIPQKSSLTADAIKTRTDEIKKATGLAKETGYYWYGTNHGNTLFAGKFYFSEFIASSTTEVLLKNELYWDKKYVNDNKTLKRIEVQSQATPIKRDVFEGQLFNLFRSGDASSFKFEGQTMNNLGTIRENPKEFGLTLVQTLNLDGTSRRTYWNLVPEKGSAGTNATPPVSNDVYAKLMWNTTTDGLEKANIKAHSALKASTTGYGLAFRSIIVAAANWNYLVSQSVTGVQVQPWLTGFAEDAKFNGKDQETSKFKIPRDAEDELNALYGVDKEGNKITLSKVANKEIKPSDNAKVITTAGTDDLPRSVGYEELKNAMKTLLDQFYAENASFKTTVDGKTVDKPIEFTIINRSFYPRFGNSTNSEHQADKIFVDLINSLDSRLKVSQRILTTAELRNPAILVSATPFRTSGWSYDYEGVGSGFDAMSWSGRGELMSIFALVVNDSDYRAKLSKSFPAIVKAADKFKEYIDSRGANFLTIPLEKWGEIPNELYTRFNTMVGSHTWDGTQYVKITDPTKISEDGGTFSSKFWLNLQTNYTNEELVELAKEVVNLIGVSTNDVVRIQTNNRSEAAHNPNYTSPNPPSGWDAFADVKVI